MRYDYIPDDIFCSEGTFFSTPCSSSPPLASEFSHEVLFTSMGLVFVGVLFDVGILKQ